MNTDEQVTIFTPHLKRWVAILVALIIVFVLFRVGSYMFGGASSRHNVSSDGMPGILPPTANNPGANNNQGDMQDDRETSSLGTGGSPIEMPRAASPGQLSDRDKMKILDNLRKK